MKEKRQESVFGHIAQLVIPCDAQHALLVEHVALALHVRVFGHIARRRRQQGFMSLTDCIQDTTPKI